MKDYTSKFLKIVALVYMAFPVTYLAVAAVVFDIPMSKIFAAFLSPFFYLLSFLAATAGYGFWEMRRWAWHLLLVVNLLVAYENAWLAHNYGESHNKVLAYVASLLLLIGLMHRIAKEVRVPYFFPKIRWWESNPRYKLSVPVRVGRPSAAKLGLPEPVLDGEILDLSMGGCFIKVRTELSLHETVAVSFKVFGQTFECEGAIVWRTQSRVTHPKGVGVKFALTTRNQKRTLRQINARLRKIAQLYRRSRYLMSQEEFTKRLDELEKGVIQDSA